MVRAPVAKQLWLVLEAEQGKVIAWPCGGTWGLMGHYCDADIRW